MAAEGGRGSKPSGRATGKRTKMTRVAIEDFHVRLQSRSPSPTAAQATTKKRRRRLNAEELGVAEGLLNLQEVLLFHRHLCNLVPDLFLPIPVLFSVSWWTPLQPYTRRCLFSPILVVFSLSWWIPLRSCTRRYLFTPILVVFSAMKRSDWEMIGLDRCLAGCWLRG